MTPEQTAYAAAVAELRDSWVAACGGLEVPFTYNRTRYLYVYNPRLHEHGYLNLDTDIVQPEMPGPGA